jgi:hypothetical protein
MSIPFKVVKGSEAHIKASAPLAGYLWFALDTRKIYYSDGTDFISMGGNSGIYYGTLTWPEDALPDTDQVEFDFTLNDIEGDAIPSVGDLILNQDGCFYRIMEVDGSTFKTLKLTIAGSGTGGGGSSGGEVGPGTTSVLTIEAAASKYFLATDNSPVFTFNVSST